MSLSQADIDARFEFGRELILRAGELAMTYWKSLETLEVKSKGLQDFVSEADYNTEVLIKSAIKERFPDDAFFGEETGPTGIEGAQDNEDLTGIWVVDPIDGTTLTSNGLNGAVSVIALAPRGTMFDPKGAFYMNKIVTGPEAASVIDITAPASENVPRFTFKYRCSGNKFSAIDNRTTANREEEVDILLTHLGDGFH